MTEEINYKEFARKFYIAMKHQSHRNDIPLYHELMHEYENAIKPKMTFVGYYNFERFVYNNKDYAFINRYWYRYQNGVFIFIEDGDFSEELSVAHLEWEKSKPV